MGIPTLKDDVPTRTQKVRLRRMRGSDIEQVARIERMSCAIPWSAQAYITEISNHAAQYFVATDGMEDANGVERVLGYGGHLDGHGRIAHHHTSRSSGLPGTAHRGAVAGRPAGGVSNGRRNTGDPRSANQ